MRLPKKISIKYIMAYILAFLTIYQSGTVPSILSIEEDPAPKIILLILEVYFAFYILLKKRNIKRFIIWFIILSSYVVINYFIYPQSTLVLMYRLCIFLLYFFAIDRLVELGIDFEQMLYKVILFFAITSLVIYCIVHLFQIPLFHNYFYLDGGKGLRYISYFGIYYEQGYANTQFGLSLYRMTGPFREPGAHQIYINYDIYLYIIRNLKSKVQFIILVIDLVLTMSSAGIAIGIFLIIVLYYRTKKITTQTKVLFGVPAFALAFFAIVEVVITKFSETYANKSSAFIRLYDFKLGMELFLENFWVGTGYYNTEPFIKRNNYNITGHLGSSNGLLTICYTTGVIGMLFVSIPFVCNFIHIDKSKKIIKLVYIMLIFLFNFVEPVYYYPFMLYLLANEYYMMFSRKSNCL